jgi:hypothetical protein
VVGIRPEDLVDAGTLRQPDDLRMKVIVRRREVIGPDVYLHFIVDAPLLLAEDPRQADVKDRLEEPWPVERTNVWLARLSSTSATEGDSIELAVPPERLHLFDPRTGAVIGN